MVCSGKVSQPPARVCLLPSARMKFHPSKAAASRAAARKMGFRQRRAVKRGVCVSYALHVIIAISYVTKKAATDWPGLYATSVNAVLVLITYGEMKALGTGGRLYWVCKML